MERGYFREDQTWNLLVDSIESTQIPQLIDLVFQQKDSQVRTNFLMPLLHHWGKINPRAALNALDSIPQFRRGQDELFTDRILSGWAYADVEKLAQWSLDQPRACLTNTALVFDPYYDAYQCEHCGVSMKQFFVASGNASEVLELGEEVFDAMTIARAVLVKVGFLRPVGMHGYDGGATNLIHTLPDGIAVVAFIHDGCATEL